MFIYNCDNVFKLAEKYFNNTYKILSDIFSKEKSHLNKEFEEYYSHVDNISVDFAWDDIGTWYLLERCREKDVNNVCIGDTKNLNNSNNIAFFEDKPGVVIGLDDVFVVKRDDIIFTKKGYQ